MTPLVERGLLLLLAGLLAFFLAFLFVMALPLDVAGKTAGASDKVFAWCPSSDLRPLVSPLSLFVTAVWSKKMLLAQVGAVLSLLDGPAGCDSGFYVVWCTFRLFRRYLAQNPSEVRRLYSLLALVTNGCLVCGPVHLFGRKRWGVIGFTWDPWEHGWVRPWSLLLSYWAGPYQHFKDAVLYAWKGKVRFDFCRCRGFREREESRCLTLLAPFSSYMQRMLEKGTRLCSEASWWRCVWEREERRGDETSFRVVCAVGFDGDGHLFWECLHLPLWFKFLKNHELHDWIQKDESTWPGCLLWHGCLRALSGTWCAFWMGCTQVGEWSWAHTLLVSWRSAYRRMVVVLMVLGRGVTPLSAHPDVWTDGSFVGDDVSGACFFGCGVL